MFGNISRLIILACQIETGPVIEIWICNGETFDIILCKLFSHQNLLPVRNRSKHIVPRQTVEQNKLCRWPHHIAGAVSLVAGWVDCMRAWKIERAKNCA